MTNRAIRNIERLRDKRRIELLEAKVEYAKLSYFISALPWWEMPMNADDQARKNRFYERQAELRERFGPAVGA